MHMLYEMAFVKLDKYVCFSVCMFVCVHICMYIKGIFLAWLIGCV